MGFAVVCFDDLLSYHRLNVYGAVRVVIVNFGVIDKEHARVPVVSIVGCHGGKVHRRSIFEVLIIYAYDLKKYGVRMRVFK